MLPAPSAANRDFRVVARGNSANQSITRTKFKAAAVSTCCRCVRARPMYRDRRSPLTAIPWESVPSTPARYEGHYPARTTTL